jgi:hypothetical protein
MTDLEPASALAERIQAIPDKTAAGSNRWPSDMKADIVAIIKQRDAAVREATLREAIEKLEIMAGSPLISGQEEHIVRACAERLRKLLTEKRTHG